MAHRTFQYYSIAATGTPQPLVGTTLTAALAANSNPDVPFLATVASSAMFRQNDYFMVTNNSTGVQERIKVRSVPSGTTVQLQGVLNNSYPSGSSVSLGILVNSTYVQAKDGNAGTLYIGNAWNMTSAGASLIAQLKAVASGTQPNEFRDGRSAGINGDDSSDFWIVGNSGDSYLPSFGVL